MVLSPSQENARVGNRTICLDLRPGAWSFDRSFVGNANANVVTPGPGQNATLEGNYQTWCLAAVRQGGLRAFTKSQQDELK